jgi:hypothetical protein
VVSAIASGLVSQNSTTVVATDLTIRDTNGPGLYLACEGLLTCTDCTLTDNAFAGAVVQAGGELVLDGALIEGTISDASTGAGLGVFAADDAQSRYGSSSLTLQDSTIRDNEMGAVYIRGGGTYQLVGNDLSGGSGLTMAPGRWVHGDAVFVTAGEEVPTTWDMESLTGVLMESNTFSDSAGAGVFLDGASATLSGNTYDGTTTDLVRQACAETDAPEGLDGEGLTTTELCPEYDYLTQDIIVTPYLNEAEAEY